MSWKQKIELPFSELEKDFDSAWAKYNEELEKLEHLGHTIIRNSANRNVFYYCKTCKQEVFTAKSNYINSQRLKNEGF